jgi:hypothetical protein
MRTLLLATLIVTFAFAVHAADITGKWTAEVTSKGFGSEMTLTNTFVFKVEGKKLTGSTNMGFDDDAEIQNGKVDGNDISFTVMFDFGGEATYKGKISGDTIAFTRTMDAEDYGTPPTTFTAKRAK